MGGVVDGIGHGGQWGVDDDLTDGLCAKRAGALVAALKTYVNMSNISAAGDLVLHQGAFAWHAAVIVGHILGQRHADALQNAALGLHAGQVRVYRGAAVNRGHIVHHLGFAGFQVNFHFGGANHKRRGRNLRAVGHGGFQRHRVAALGCRCNAGQRYALGAVLARHGIAGKQHGGFVQPKQLCPQGADLIFQFQRTLFHGLAGHIGCAGRIGTGIIGGRIGICAQNRNVFQRAFQHFGSDLRQDRIAAGAHIRCADGEGIEPVIVNFQRGTAHVHMVDAGALHGHAHANSTHLAVADLAHGVLMVPIHPVMHGFQAAVQRTAGVDLAIVGGHNIALMDNVALPELERVHPQFVGQLIHSGFHRKQTLGCAVPAVRTR